MQYSFYTIIVFVLCGYCTSLNPDDSLPPYLRDLKWNEVEHILQEDLSLSNSVVPSNYVIELDVNVRGHAGAEKSDFNGTVTIYLNITKPTNKIELHSNGLTIETAILAEHAIFTEPAGVSRISSNPDRETITIHVNRTIQPEEDFMLQIAYSGVAKMNEYGLYESWDPKFNKSLDSNGPYILATNNFPTGARFWFPCFDEPDKTAAFEIRVNHPSGLSAYSSADIERIERISDGRTLSVFAKTRPLATYQVALSVNHLATKLIDVHGFGKVRLISSSNSHDHYSSIPLEFPGLFGVYTRMTNSIDIFALLKQKLEQQNAFSINKSVKEKLDIVILEGSDAVNVQPGLITIGRAKFWKEDKPTDDLGFLNHLKIGNFITAPSLNLMWMNDMFSHFTENETEPGIHEIPSPKLDASLHERSLRDVMVHPTSTRQYLASKKDLHSRKASHILRLFVRFCPSSVDTIQTYLNEQKSHDVDRFIEKSSMSCEDASTAKEFLESYINQPGKMLLIVKRTKDAVVITQTRYHSTYFDEALRDNRTRYTVPIFYTIDGIPNVTVFSKKEAHLKIPVPESSLFLIEHKYDHLYYAFYEDIIMLQRNFTEEERRNVVLALSKSMIAAANIGYVKYTQLYEQFKVYVESRIFRNRDHWAIFYALKQLIPILKEWTYFGDSDELFHKRRCAELRDWNGMFNNDTTYWEMPANSRHFNFVINVNCIDEWTNSSVYWSFLENNFLGDNSVIRPDLYSRLITRKYIDHQWRELHRFFFRNAGNFTNHRFDLLADLVLNEVRMERHPDTDNYPNTQIRDEYLNELRDFVKRSPKRAASMSTDIEMRLEREFVRRELPKWHNESINSMFDKYNTLYEMEREEKAETN